jgi:hypothetical protein
MTNLYDPFDLGEYKKACEEYAPIKKEEDRKAAEAERKRLEKLRKELTQAEEWRKTRILNDEMEEANE